MVTKNEIGDCVNPDGSFHKCPGFCTFGCGRRVIYNEELDRYDNIDDGKTHSCDKYYEGLRTKKLMDSVEPSLDSTLDSFLAGPEPCGIKD